MSVVFKVGAVEGGGWVREVLDGRPLVTGDPREAVEFPDRSTATRVANDLNRLRKVQWRAVEHEPTPDGSPQHPWPGPNRPNNDPPAKGMRI